VSGVYNVLSEDELEITELPIGKWTRDYKNFLEELA
jgi:DNA topoisomerase-2